MPPQPPPLKKKSRLPLLISAFVCPGAGQCLQGRWAVGLFFTVTFVLAFMGLALPTIWPLSCRLRRILLPGLEPDAPPPAYDLRTLRVSAMLLALIYLWNVADVWWRGRRPPTPAARPPP